MKRSYFSLLMAGFLLLGLFSFTGNAQATARKPIKVLMVGGGSSHDFDTWYKGSDVNTLQRDGFAEVVYLDNVQEILKHLASSDVLFLSNNQPMNDPATREAIFSFVESGKGLVLAHAALWYNWADWPEYNTQLVSGGSKGHDAYGNFRVSLTKRHPVTKGLEKSFELKDELYYYKADPAGPGIEVLAEASRIDAEGSFPSVFVVKNPKARIVGIALGHDAESHEIANYQTLIRNAVKWAAGK